MSPLWGVHTVAATSASVPHDGRLKQDLCTQRLETTFTMPCKACCLQNAGAMLPSLLKRAVVLQETSEQSMIRPFTMPSLACCLQYTAVLSLAMTLGRFSQRLCEQRMLSTSPMLSLACCLQDLALFLLSTPKAGTFEQESGEQRFLRRFTIPSSA